MYLVGVFIGLIVLFDTSMDELAEIFGAILNFLPKLFPSSVLGFFQKKPINKLGESQMIIKGIIRINRCFN